MRILVVHQYFLFPGQPGGSRFNEMCRDWAEAGHHVQVISGTLNYATGAVPERYRGRWITREKDGDVVVWRCHVPASYRKSTLGRMWAFFGFTLSSLAAAFRAGIPDAVIASSPPLIVALAGWAAARLRGRPVPWIFEIRDLWPESAVTTGVLRPASLLTRLLYRLEAWACHGANRVNVLTPAFRDDLVKRRLASDSKIVFVPNGADLDAFQPGPRDNEIRCELGWGDRFVILYAGAHGKANAVGQLVAAAELLRDRPDILIASVGDGPERRHWADEVDRKGLTNIRFHGPQPKERMPLVVQACDVGAAVLQDNPTFRTVYPNKVFDYMACARPTLLAIDGVARDLVCRDARAGVFAVPEDPRSFADQIVRLAGDPSERAEMGRRGLEWVVRNCGRQALAEKYLSILQDMVEGRSRGRATPPGPKRSDGTAKALVERGLALLGLLLLSPLLALIAMAVLVTMGRPILFRQTRPGKRGKPFGLVKFRTMKVGAGADGPRLTPLGRFLRETSLDELPELWNVVRGEMSLVGPRPLLMQYLTRYNPEQARRHEVLPGITGWAQIHGRNAIGWDEKFRLDVWYVDHQTVLLDLKIVLRTLAGLLRREGIQAPGYATMPEFMGSMSASAHELEGAR